MKYSQKLATLCDMLQVIDPNGFYHELLELYSNGDITLSEAIESLRLTVTDMIDDIGQDKQLIEILDYINY